MAIAEPLKSSHAKMMNGEHIMVRLTYISRYNSYNLKGEVSSILAQAQQNNSQNGITGALIFNHNYFLQSIEGSRPVINDLLRKLVKDERHFSLQVIECSEIEQRRWDKWSMKYLIPSVDNKEHLLKFSAGTEFNPYLMSTNQIMLFIDALSKQQQRQEQQHKQAIEKKKSWFGRR